MPVDAMRAFVLADGPTYVAALEPAERTVLLDVVDGVVELLGGRAGRAGRGVAEPRAGQLEDPVADPLEDPLEDPLRALRLGAGPVSTPTDPALLRLLPDAAADRWLAAELRRLTESDLRGTKLNHLARLRAAIEDARPDLAVVPRDAPAVAAALTDLRLVLASRLGVQSDADADAVYDLAAQDGPAATQPEATARFLAAVYAVLTELQESLVGLLVDALPPVRDTGSV